MNELEALTVKELQDKLVELGMPLEDAEVFKTKAPMIAAINAMAAKDAVVKEEKEDPEEAKKVKTIEEAPNPAEDREVNKRWVDKANKMRLHLYEQEMVSILIPLEAGQIAGVVVWEWDKGGRIEDLEWEKLSIDEKMKTHQVHVSGAFESVQLNGYKVFIPKGRYYRVFRQIAEVISKSQQQTLEAGSDISLNRVDPRTGRPFSEMM